MIGWDNIINPKQFLGMFLFSFQTFMRLILILYRDKKNSTPPSPHQKPKWYEIFPHTQKSQNKKHIVTLLPRSNNNIKQRDNKKRKKKHRMHLFVFFLLHFSIWSWTSWKNYL